MSRLIYIMPWAVCDTEHVYIKKEENVAELPKATQYADEWYIRGVVPSPDRRTKDIYVILDPYNGFAFHEKGQGGMILSPQNTINRLQTLGYSRANEGEQEFILKKVLAKKK